ncbi:TetR/AcrR family transcriptional regulator C-terminal domain-containing protein [Actinoplanes sp. NPDC051851]|uniref:TetR/AcrR family transcriptional regulator n=1 Tax=Actinoplanes sp. NPDC051851 TaxID=3154753 RepID=UPI003412171B
MASDKALSRDRIVDTAIAMLDAAGESGLTFRALSARLKTGPGAIYWHVANKGELLAAATDTVVTRAMAADPAAATPPDEIRAIALGVFDAFDAHPWIGDQLSQLSAQPTTLRVFESLGRRVQSLGVPPEDQFNAASALLNYILGVAAQNAALARSVARGTDRTEVLAAVDALFAGVETGDFPFLRSVATQLRTHDDRDQFLAGINLILAGIVSLNEGTSRRSPAVS